MRWEASGWEKGGWGFWSLRRWTGRATLAYRNDGGSVERYTQKNYRNWFVSELGRDRSQIRFPAEPRTIEVDHLSKEYKVSPVVRGGLTVRDASDSDCTKAALAFDLSELKRVGQGVVAGIGCVRYTGVRARDERVDLWLAPSLGCTQMLVIRSRHNGIGFLISYSLVEAVTVQIGEPDGTLFDAPVGYRYSH